MERFRGLRREVRAIMKDVPPHHGREHAEEVGRFSRILAYLEGGNLNSSETSGLLHDLRKRDDDELKVRKIRVNWGEMGTKVDAMGLVRKHRREIFPARLVISSLGREKLFWEAFSAYRDILQAVKVSESGKISNLQKPERKSAQILGDADRLSRSGIEGLKSILEANRDYNVPFYKDGGEIVRVKDAPIIPFDHINSCVDDINVCTGDWEKMMETSSGKLLLSKLDQTNHQFLSVFSNNTDIRDYEIWIGWLDSILVRQESQRQKVNSYFNKGEYEKFLYGRLALEDPSLLSGENFQKYLCQGNKKII